MGGLFGHLYNLEAIMDQALDGEAILKESVGHHWSSYAREVIGVPDQVRIKYPPPVSAWTDRVSLGLSKHLPDHLHEMAVGRVLSQVLPHLPVSPRTVPCPASVIVRSTAKKTDSLNEYARQGNNAPVFAGW